MELSKPLEIASRVALEVGIKVGSFVIGVLERIEPMDNPLEGFDDE